jgi:hypothetical protein
MGEVDQVDDAVHHGVAQRHQRVHAAQHQTVDDLLQQDIHGGVSPVLGPAARAARIGSAWARPGNVCCG